MWERMDDQRALLPEKLWAMLAAEGFQPLRFIPMKNLKALDLKPIILTALFSNVLVGCITSALNAYVKQICVKQDAVVGSRMARSTCKPEVAGNKEETAAATIE